MMTKSTRKASKGSPTSWLQKWQKNRIFKTIQAVGLDPKEFDLEDDEVEVRIKHRWSESCFIVGGDAGHYVGRYVVGDAPDWPFEAYSWQAMIARTSSWLEDVKHDLETPDLWASVGSIGATPSPPATVAVDRPTGFDELLHPLVREAAIRHYQARDFRNAVLDAITAVFDKIRERTGVDQDGERLINQTMSLQAPILVLSELETESGRNDQSGFMDIFKGFYRGVRNPKAHSLVHDLDANKAGQHLVLASILMRRVIEARLIIPVKASVKAKGPR